MSQLEVKKTPDGRTLARRTDGQSLTSQDREEIKALLAGPPCWNCGTKTTEVVDIYGRSWWRCWACAKRV